MNKVSEFTLTPAEFREKWAEALESGRFTQGTQFLTRRGSGGDLDCCLGVACKVYVDLGGEIDAEDGVLLDDEEEERNVRLYAGEGQVLPAKVQAALGLATDSGHLVIGTAVDASTLSKPSLTSANDEGVGFLAIARLIREDKVQLAASR